MIPCQIFLWRISQSEIQNSAAKTPSPKPARIPPQTPPAGGKSAESALIVWIRLEIVSNFIQQTPYSITVPLNSLPAMVLLKFLMFLPSMATNAIPSFWASFAAMGSTG